MTEKKVEVIFTPVEYAALRGRDLSNTRCVVFDILRATTTMLTALANGAAAMIPVAEIPEGLALRAQDPELLLAGERGGFRISRELTGGIDFDFGNSPREFLKQKVQGRRIAITTTNGTRALRACAHAIEAQVGAFLNLSALAQSLERGELLNLLILCAGTAEEASLEDTLAAGALVDRLTTFQLTDSALVARATYLHHRDDLLAAIKRARNGRKLLSIPELAPDVEVCLQRDTLQMTAKLDARGAIRAA